MGSTRGPEDERGGEPTSADQMIDEAEEESFPASDPQSFWAGPDEPPHDRDAGPGQPA